MFRRSIGSFIIGMLLFFLTGCVVETVPVPVEAPPLTPPAQVEIIPTSPGPAYIWVPGHWAWRGPRRGYVWLPGHWTLPVQPGYVWELGHWEPGPSGYLWIEGRWRVR